MLLKIITIIVLAMLLGTSLALSETVQTTNGPVVGIRENGFFSWKGIPYAKASRWQNPENPFPWTQTLQTRQYGPSCPQTRQMGADIQAEACLFVNVWSPLNAVSSPVLVYIHGGGYMFGSGAVPYLQGSHYANSTNIVVVNFNYRLGMLGFLAGDSLKGNYGLRDQVFALQWVQKNIASFGGDPTKVTLAGQSAGGIAVGTHLTMPSTSIAKPFRSAIVQSNPLLMGYRYLKDQQPQFDVVSSYFGCRDKPDTVACLKALDWQKIVDGQMWGLAPLLANVTWRGARLSLIYAPSIDGELVTQQPMDAFVSGNYYKVPIMMGLVSNETAGFMSLVFGDHVGTPLLSSLFYKYGFDALLGKANADITRALYPGIQHGEVNDESAIARVLTDFAFTCPIIWSASSIVNKSPIYVYQFAHSPSCDPFNYKSKMCVNRVCHSVELPFEFQSIKSNPAGPVCDWSSTDYSVSDEVVKRWSDFVSLPNSEFAKLWAPFTGSNILKIKRPATSITYSLAAESQCDWWTRIYNEFKFEAV